MPLEKSTSKKAFEKNIKTEYKAKRKEGESKKKADKQSVAIAFSEKRSAEGKKAAATRKKKGEK